MRRGLTSAARGPGCRCSRCGRWPAGLRPTGPICTRPSRRSWRHTSRRSTALRQTWPVPCARSCAAIPGRRCYPRGTNPYRLPRSHPASCDLAGHCLPSRGRRSEVDGEARRDRGRAGRAARRQQAVPVAGCVAAQALFLLPLVRCGLQGLPRKAAEMAVRNRFRAYATAGPRSGLGRKRNGGLRGQKTEKLTLLLLG
jgi:hypothetical protein